jgi:hypothetical protein
MMPFSSTVSSCAQSFIAQRRLRPGGFLGAGFSGAPPARAPKNPRCLSVNGCPRTSSSRRIVFAFSGDTLEPFAARFP